MMIHTCLSSPRSAIMAVFAAFGAAVGTLAGAAPSVMRAAAIDNPSFGVGLTVSTGMTVLAMVLGGALGRVISNRAVLLAALPLFWLAVAAFVTSTAPFWFFAAFLPMGFMFGLTDVFMNAEATAIEHDLRKPIFTAFHGTASIFTAVYAIAASLIATTLGTGFAAALAGAAFAIAWILVYRNVPGRPLVKGRELRIMALPNRQPLVLLGLATGLVVAAETAALLWSAKLLDDMAPQLAAIAGLGAAFFGLCNALVRFRGDAIRARFGDFIPMVASIGVAIAGFMVLGFSADFALSVAAFACVGFGVAVLIPCIFATVARLVPGNRVGALGFVALISSPPRILGPAVFGWMAGSFGTSFAFGLIALALALALGLIVALMRGKQVEQVA